MTHRIFHLRGIRSRPNSRKNVIILPMPQATTPKYIIALTLSFRNWRRVGRSRMSRIGWKFWSWGSLMNHIAPDRMILRHPDNNMTNWYLKNETNEKLVIDRVRKHGHEHGANHPMIKCWCERRIPRKSNPQCKRCIWKQIEGANVEHDATSQRK